MVAYRSHPDDACMVPTSSPRAHRARTEPVASFSRIAIVVLAGIVFGVAYSSRARAQASPDSTAADSTAPALTPRVVERPSTPMPRGIADTVTVLPPVDVNGERSAVPGRSTATEVRLHRGAI